MKIMTIQELLSNLSQENRYYFIQTLISSLIECNPNRKDLSSADWYNYILEEYNAAITPQGITLQPK